MEFPNRRVLLSKTMAKAEFQQKMNNMKLPKVEQEHFFRRYDFFEKKAFKTMNDFRKTKNSKSMNTLFSTFESEFNKPKKVTFTPASDGFIPDAFKRNVSNFQIRKVNPIYRSMSASGLIDTTTVACG
jgi:hypothetical protein